MVHSLFTKKHLDLNFLIQFTGIISGTSLIYVSASHKFNSSCHCEELKIKSPHLGEAAKRAAVAELAIHIRRSTKFYTALKQKELDAKENKNTNILAISIDFIMNISLPKELVYELFYLR